MGINAFMWLAETNNQSVQFLISDIGVNIIMIAIEIFWILKLPRY